MAENRCRYGQRWSGRVRTGCSLVFDIVEKGRINALGKGDTGEA
jgi:hypothetical protein